MKSSIKPTKSKRRVEIKRMVKKSLSSINTKQQIRRVKAIERPPPKGIDPLWIFLTPSGISNKPIVFENFLKKKQHKKAVRIEKIKLNSIYQDPKSSEISFASDLVLKELIPSETLTLKALAGLFNL